MNEPALRPRPGIRRMLERARLDFPAEPTVPDTVALVVATTVAAALSLAADAALVAVGHAAFPATAHYSHFAFWDYGSLTVIGVGAAGAAWAGVARVSSEPRRLLARLAVGVSAVLLLPDLWLLAEHNPVGGVGILMSMHIVIAVITFFALVTIAPARAPRKPREVWRPAGPGLDTAVAGEEEPAPGAGALVGRAPWLVLLLGVLLELAVGAAALFVAPLGRPTGLVPHRGEAVYLVHSVLGLGLALGALWAFGASRRLPNRGRDRDRRLGASLGLIGLALAGLGGVGTVVHGSLRVVGLGLMLLGTVVALLGYSLPLISPAPAPLPAGASPSTEASGRAATGTEPAAPPAAPPVGWALTAPSPRRQRRAAQHHEDTPPTTQRG